MKSVVLCRVSSKEQEETGYSLGAQEKFLNSYREKQGYQLTKLFSISESASGRKQRELFDQMISFVKKEKINIIICEKVDRLTRNFKDMVMIDEWLEEDETRQVHLVKDSLVMHKNSRSQEKLNWGIRILFAKNYVDNLSEEVKKGQKEKISQGWLPTKPPYGYKTIGESGHKEHIIVHCIQRVADIFRLSPCAIISHLRGENIEAAHAVVPLAGEVHGAAIRVNEHAIFVVRRVDHTTKVL